MKILFADDEDSILEVVKEFFEYKGHEVITAKNGLEAKKIIEQEQIDCCVTDINMPGMNGLELAEYLRKTDNTIPVVIMTGYPSIDNTIKTLKNGVVDFLIKPIDLHQLELCINRILRERQLFIENLMLKKEVEGKEKLERLNLELLNKVEELNILKNIMGDFSTIATSQDVFKHIKEMSLEVTGADISKFYLINEDDKKLFEVSLNKTRDPVNMGDRLEELILESACEGTPLLMPESAGVDGISDNILSFIAVPLKIREKVLGILAVLITGGNLSLTKKGLTKKGFTKKDLYYLSFMTDKAAYAIENLALYENIYDNLLSTLFAFVNAIEARDPYTQQHSSRVAGISVKIGEELNCSAEELDILNFAGQLHDIGKIGIRDAILLKPGKLTDEEFDVIRSHPVIGANMIEQLGLWDREKLIIRHHHERFDGNGYPDKLKGEEIPFLARIMSVADVYDAMASDRAYRKKMDVKKILGIIESEEGCQFDPKVVKAFLKIFNEGKID